MKLIDLRRVKQVQKGSVAAGKAPRLDLGVLGISIGQKQSTGDTSIAEETYDGNIGVMEMFKFFDIATAEQKKQMRELIAAHKQDEAWALLQQVTGAELK